MSKPTPVLIADAAVPLPAKPRVDREKCVVYDVLAIGVRSANGWEYPREFLRTAETLIDGLACNWGHHLDPVTKTPVEPPPGAKLGIHRNPVLKADGWHTDIRYNPKNAHAEEFLWACENEPSLLGLSQLASVARKPALDANGHKVADNYLALFSIDVVSTPASTNTIFDAVDPSLDPSALTPDPTTQGKPVALDPKAIAAQLTDAGQVEAFLKSLFDALGSIDPATKATILESLVAAVTGAQVDLPEDGSGDDAVADALDRLKGAKYRRGAKLVRATVADRKAKARREWADKLIADAALPDDLRSDVFTETVADCFGNEAKAKALIEDRARFSAAESVADAADRRPKSSPPGKVKSLKEIADGYSAGE